MSLPVNEQPASISPPPPTSSAGGAEGPDGPDGNDGTDALSEGLIEGGRNTQLAMHSANIGMMASNRIVDLLRHGLETAARPQCSRDATPDRVAVGACARSTRPWRAGLRDCVTCAIARLRDCAMRLAAAVAVQRVDLGDPERVVGALERRARGGELRRRVGARPRD